MEKYLPFTDADDDCTNHVCKCGVQSRVETSSDFGLHCTYAAGKNECRSKANGGVTVEEVEALFTSKLGDWSTYATDANVRAWSDYHTSFYLGGSLDSLVANFKRDGVSYHSGSWKNSTGTFYTVMFQVPNTQAILEIWSDSCSTCGSYVFEEARQDTSRLFLGLQSATTEFYATQVGRAVSNLTEVIDFYKQAFGVSPKNGVQALSDGSQYVDFNFGTEVDIRYTKRTGQTGDRTTDWFQNLLVTTAKHYMTGVTACWPVWGDNHFAYDGSYSTANVLSGASKTSFGSYFKPVKAGLVEQAYFLEPSGWQIQLDGQYSSPSGTEGFDPEYCSTSCQSAFNEIVV